MYAASFRGGDQGNHLMCLLAQTNCLRGSFPLTNTYDLLIDQIQVSAIVLLEFKRA